MQRWTISNGAVTVGLTAEGGFLDPVVFHLPGRDVRPLHVAPWADTAESESIDPQVLRHLRGDFFCAPFGESDVLTDERRIHGAPCNGRWRLLGQTAAEIEAELEAPVAGARLRKRVFLRPGEPLVYQEHVFHGGSGEIPIGHHAMLHAAEPLNLSFSPFVWAATPPAPLEPDPQRGRSLLAYPQSIAALDTVRLADGGTTDLTRYPALERHEDLLMLAADPNAPLAWSAAVAARGGWVWFELRAPRVLPGTVLWFSNGGRFYPPWNGRHVDVLGIEAVCAYFNLGHQASSRPNPLAEQGVPTTLRLRSDGAVAVRTAFGLAAAPHSFARVSAMEYQDNGIRLADSAGGRVFAPCDMGFVLG